MCGTPCADACLSRVKIAVNAAGMRRRAARQSVQILRPPVVSACSLVGEWRMANGEGIDPVVRRFASDHNEAVIMDHGREP